MGVGGCGCKEGTLVVLAGFFFLFFLVRGLFLLTHNVTNLILKHAYFSRKCSYCCSAT